MHHNWPVRKAIANLPIRMKGNSKHSFINSLSLWGTQNKNKDNNAALQMLLTKVKLFLQYRLVAYLFSSFN